MKLNSGSEFRATVGTNERRGMDDEDAQRAAEARILGIVCVCVWLRVGGAFRPHDRPRRPTGRVAPSYRDC